MHRRPSEYRPPRKDDPRSVAGARLILRYRREVETVAVTTMCALHNLTETTARQILDDERRRREDV